MLDKWSGTVKHCKIHFFKTLKLSTALSTLSTVFVDKKSYEFGQNWSKISWIREIKTVSGFARDAGQAGCVTSGQPTTPLETFIKKFNLLKGNAGFTGFFA
ncbi:MAG: hypothetical protein FWC78_04710 [Defluviitaleaceae bacterium]|nr:hypothetical protein [Defluviitaleaceae bacterium]